jgi:hypothetical protein
MINFMQTDFNSIEELLQWKYEVDIAINKELDNQKNIKQIEIVEKLLKTSKIISITEDTPDLHNPYQKETIVKFITNINPENN